MNTRILKLSVPSLLLGMLFLLNTGSASAQAQNDTVVQRVTSTFFLISPCTGEQINFTSEAQILQHFRSNNNGTENLFHVNTQAEGVGATSGDIYHFHLTRHEDFTFAFNGAFERTMLTHTRVTSEGPGGNFDGFFQFHFTFNANGELTANVVNVSAECRGSGN